MNWYKTALFTTKNYNKSIQEHVKGVLEADVSYPIFVTQDHHIIDGMHRMLKSILLNQPIKAIVLSAEDLSKAILNPKESYTGQVYVTDLADPSGQGKEYAVNKIIQLYQNKPTTTLNPQELLTINQDGWGGISPNKVLELARQQMPSQAPRMAFKPSYLNFLYKDANSNKKFGKCLRKALELIDLDPSLTLMMGPPDRPHDTSHFWTVTQNGMIIDPASDTVGDDYPYIGIKVNPDKIKEELFQ